MPLRVSSTCVHHQEVKIVYYTASGIITPIGGGLVHRLREDQAKFPTPSLCLIWLEIKKKVGHRYEEERGRRDMTQLREGFRNRFLKGS